MLLGGLFAGLAILVAVAAFFTGEARLAGISETEALVAGFRMALGTGAASLLLCLFTLPEAQIGAALNVGLLLLAFWAGYRTGRKAAPTTPGQP